MQVRVRVLNGGKVFGMRAARCAGAKRSRPSFPPVVGTDDTVRCLKFSFCQYNDAEWKNERIPRTTTSKSSRE
ncbi:hypothetical protein CEXT_272321 [Caerostris extrusa]|uniref:Uncharacterized protein n=1 Tax=Caerostris extrusa TaxID=172846 RepID=A0AAV4T186_CAEEX|nr:hypothetical protein CEXT_272321 [Caerostris extrusa]